jgi:hypothetical protein
MPDETRCQKLVAAANDGYDDDGHVRDDVGIQVDIDLAACFV